MPLYETVLIARQDMSENQVNTLSQDFSQLLEQNGGQTKRVEPWGLRNLAYRINKNRKGYYVLFHFDAPASAIIELERNMRISEDVLRFMTVRIDTLPEGPSAILRKRDDEDDVESLAPANDAYRPKVSRRPTEEQGE